MLLENTNSAGRLPSSELWDRLRRLRPARSPRDGETSPLRPLEATKTSVTVPSPLQRTPSHWQQSVPFTHDTLRLPLPPGTSPPRKPRRALLSCSVQELVGETKQSRRATATRPANGVDDLVVYLLLLLRHDELSGCMVPSHETRLTQGCFCATRTLIA
ncbi:hypothetical protein VPH35_139227 [Triticum aestivum]